MRQSRGETNREYKPKSDAEISRNMSAIRSSLNQTEVALGKALHARGFRYRKYVRNLPGKPDFAFVRAKVAVFVDGDFWHARVLREGGISALQSILRTPRRSYWIDKFDRRMKRDDYVTMTLESEGWKVIRLWESDVKRDIDQAAKLISTEVQLAMKRMPRRISKRK
jgi:DNA mismatch endonuclease (patch repair protein)